MAWLKEIVDPNTGATAVFWEVMGISYNHRAQKSVLEVGGWISQEHYNNNKSPLMFKYWEIPSGLAPELAAGAVGFVTGFARAKPEFEESQDVT